MTLRRDPARLAAEPFDVAVVGAGIHGAWAALDAAQRGLRVALVDQGDFGGATSANSQRIVHGGLRYLQHGDLARMRESIRERSVLLRVAPHLVRPMACVVPTEGLGLRSRLVLGTASLMNDALSWDRNRRLSDSRRLPRGRLLSRAEVLERFPLLSHARLDGGLLFHDAQVSDSERLCLCVVHSASRAGAEVANHVRVTGLLRERGSVVGLDAEDRLTGDTFSVRAGLVLNCTGPWTAETLTLSGDPAARQARRARYPVFKAVVLLTRPIVEHGALAVAGEAGHRDDAEIFAKGFRNYFVTPWHDASLIGTFYAPFEDHPDHLRVTPDEIAGHLEAFDGACPGLGLGYDDVRHVFAGLLPATCAPGASPEPIYAKRHRIVDHEREDGTPGCISAVGVKWTTARRVAAEAVDLAARKLGVAVRESRTHDTPLFGGDLDDPEGFAASPAVSRPEGLDAASFAHLLATYGTAYTDVLRGDDADASRFRRLHPQRPEIAAEARHAVRSEMALTLCDLVFRRTGLAKGGWPGLACLEACAGIMAEELGWSAAERQRQVDEVRQAFQALGVAHGG